MPRQLVCTTLLLPRQSVSLWNAPLMNLWLYPLGMRVLVGQLDHLDCCLHVSTRQCAAHIVVFVVAHRCRGHSPLRSDPGQSLLSRRSLPRQGSRRRRWLTRRHCLAVALWTCNTLSSLNKDAVLEERIPRTLRSSINPGAQRGYQEWPFVTDDGEPESTWAGWGSQTEKAATRQFEAKFSDTDLFPPLTA
jgi:hypothetical protein